MNARKLLGLIVVALFLLCVGLADLSFAQCNVQPATSASVLNTQALAQPSFVSTFAQPRATATASAGGVQALQLAQAQPLQLQLQAPTRSATATASSIAIPQPQPQLVQAVPVQAVPVADGVACRGGLLPRRVQRSRSVAVSISRSRG